MNDLTLLTHQTPGVVTFDNYEAVKANLEAYVAQFADMDYAAKQAQALGSTGALGDAKCKRMGNFWAYIRHLIVDEGMPEDFDFSSYIDQNGLYPQAIAYNG